MKKILLGIALSCLLFTSCAKESVSETEFCWDCHTETLYISPDSTLSIVIVDTVIDTYCGKTEDEITVIQQTIILPDKYICKKK
jgi:hypothetical protein